LRDVRENVQKEENGADMEITNAGWSKSLYAPDVYKTETYK
jgi:hypothetical protein